MCSTATGHASCVRATRRPRSGCIMVRGAYGWLATCRPSGAETSKSTCDVRCPGAAHPARAGRRPRPSREISMTVRLKKLHDQVMVITGASSGIGLATARMAARQGAKVVLACRNQQALDEIVESIRAEGGDALAVQADVGVAADHDRILGAATEKYGLVDTWVNNAGVSIFGRLEDVPVEDQRKLFDTNYWGVVYGSITAVAHLKKHGGALINIG